MTGCSCSDEAGFGIAHVPTLIENIVRHHLSLYDEDFEGWRKL